MRTTVRTKVDDKACMVYSALLRLLLHDHSFLLCLWFGLSSSRMFPSPILLDPPRFQHRPFELISLMHRLRKMSTPTYANNVQHECPSMMAQGCAKAPARYTCGANAYSPGHLSDLDIHFPSFLKRVPVLHRRTFPRINNSQFIRSFGFPYPHVPVVRP